MARSQEITERIRAAVTLPAREFVDQYLFVVAPYAFRLAPSEYQEFRNELSSRLDIAVHNILLMGSGRLGFSLNPEHLLRPFGRKSDLDIVIVSSEVFDDTQNKKTTLDIAFQKFEPTFPEKQHWLKRFEDARNATQELLPDIANTRWRGKSDYYSLFLALDALNQTGHIRNNRRGTATRALQTFGESITKRLSKAARGPVASNIRRYATAVEKAASDKDRRQTRQQILVKLLGQYYTTR